MFYVRLNGSLIGSFNTIEEARQCMFANEGACIDTQKETKPSWYTVYSMRLGEGASEEQARYHADLECS